MKKRTRSRMNLAKPASFRVPARLRKLYEAALKARDHAHAPYSKCQVGSALLLENGKVYVGCNVENSTFGATTCAERGAVQASVAGEGKPHPKEILVVTDASPPWPPCGLCRQVLSEFAGPQLNIHLVNLQGEYRTTTLGELMPEAFTPSHLL